MVYVTTDGEIVYSLPRVERRNTENEEPTQNTGEPARKTGISGITGGVVLRERLLGSCTVAPVGAVEANAKVSYFLGSDPEQWKRGLSTWDTLGLGEAYEGIEVALRAYGNNVEKLFTVRPGADPGCIRVEFKGIDGLSVTEDGSLVAVSRIGEVRFTAPVAYQEVDGERREIAAAYRVQCNRYTFELGEYDRERSLVIDPLLASTFIGSPVLNSPTTCMWPRTAACS